MAKIPAIDKDYLLDVLVKLLNTPSPTGFSHYAITELSSTLSKFKNVELHATRKGDLVATMLGESDDRPRGLTAHVDTLGAVVKEVKSNGRLKLSPIGGYAWSTVEGEGCTIHKNNGETVRGTIQLTKASGHVHGQKTRETKREVDNMEVRLDVKTSKAKETREFGIEVGDFVAYDPRVEVTNGFIRSRHLDDKAGVAALVAAIKAMDEAGLKPAQTTTFLFSTFEEVGHGAANGFPDDLTELVAVDMAAIGDGQNSDEFHASICTKDGAGPYHHGLTQRLRKIADKHEIPYKVDVYTFYGSDAEAYWRAGGDVSIALIGPGVDASHSYERTHMDALVGTTNWVLAYLLEK
jgi:putative aminopeptidase FrvX